MDRFWLLTWTTYGTWMPGDDRGFVSNVPRGSEHESRRNKFGTACDRSNTFVEERARSLLVGVPISLRLDHAVAVAEQFEETARHRGWHLLALAVMANHSHVLVGVPGDPEPDTLLRDFKAYASRSLNKKWPKPPSGTWWTEGGSTRKKEPHQLPACVEYIRNQYGALVVRIYSEVSGGRQPLDTTAPKSGGLRPPLAEDL